MCWSEKLGMERRPQSSLELEAESRTEDQTPTQLFRVKRTIVPLDVGRVAQVER